MRIPYFLMPIVFCFSMIGCNHNNQPQSDQVSSDPVYVPTTPSQDVPVAAPVQSDDSPAILTADDNAIIDSVLANGESRDVAPSVTNDRAVVFGDNYPGTPAELHGCVNDAKKNVLNLVKIDHFNPRNIRLILNEKCTKKNYEAWTIWVLANAVAGDRRFWGSSSHGAEDTDTAGNLIDVLVTFDMISKGVWDETTEVSPDFWAKTLRATTVDFLFINDSCHAGGQMRQAIGLAALKNKRLVRSIDGPPAVQARINAATQRGTSLRALTLTGTVVWACQPSELSEEDSIHGGLGTDAWWKARKNLLNTSPKAGDIVREANRILHSEYAASQHEGLTGQNKVLYSKE